jgi:hypothetical protein
MSLISIRNLAGPFRSKVQMGGLAIIIILVLVIRLGTSRSTDKDPADTIRTGETDELLQALNDGQKSKPGKRSKVQDDVLEGLVADGFDDNQDAKPTMPAQSESFDDIRKSLGLD